MKRCKGPCCQEFPQTAEFFQRCKKYKKDGLESWCKACSKAKRKAREARAKLKVCHPARYYVDAHGRLRCLHKPDPDGVICDGQIYDSGLDDEWNCIRCGAYVNPPPKPARLASKL
jgi:hypothetical protein